MFRFISTLTTGTVAAFLVVATTTFSEPTVQWLAFAISIGVALVAAATAFAFRRQIATVVTEGATAVVACWTIVATQVFALPTVENLVLASALAVAGLSIIGITLHELSIERALDHARNDGRPVGARLSTAA